MDSQADKNSENQKNIQYIYIFENAYFIFTYLFYKKLVYFCTRFLLRGKSSK